ncbi:redox-sensitive transcriptional activator SoxR [Jannaschia sp. M317]|uniref:redox-sensitive transcriptional activator SoxR n=1 Tax=Jannaschia sp. M317 TaxID=2867011 RepID=UPI0021A84AA6|nr:redox-sensitive transcriptional activator SoxR [Jannaschia sp. M317]UWQ18543.1 redox-sensitive transcriptional activator SoxR [Jannaschia sp. M317]
MLPRELSIGQMATRTGLTVSQIRFYEKKGLIAPPRNAGGQRRFPRAELRRLAFIRIAQRLGLSLRRIAAALGPPGDRPPSPAEWAAIAQGMHADLTERIDQMTRLRDMLGGCIGCGCLSMDHCALYNPDDVKAAEGPGARNVE